MNLINWDIDWVKVADLLIYDPANPMVFNSSLFLFFFFVFLTGYQLLAPNSRAKAVYVVLFSFYFYYKSSGGYLLLLLWCIGIDYLLARLLHVTQRRFWRKMLLGLSLCSNLGMLLYFKYTNFLLDTVAQVQGSDFQRWDIFLPIGISFFTFQSLSYTIDVYRRQMEPTRNLLDYAFFVSFFPLLVAGPIVRASHFLPQLKKPLLVDHESFGRGVFLILCGLFKKAVVADYISVNFVDRVFDNPLLYSGMENLLAIYGYALQIYGDFSGYSDMAIGLALLLGFRFGDHFNFHSPYQALNITDFWRRWHISLSTWLRDYLYISLGGNRKGAARAYLNQLLTMLLGGLWHGASLRFLLWGALHGVALALHKIWMKATRNWQVNSSTLRVAAKCLAWLLTFHFVCFCWIFFRASDMEAAGNMISQLIHTFRPYIFVEFVRGYPLVVALMGLGFLLHAMPDSWERGLQKMVIHMPMLLKVLAFVLMVYLVAQLKSSEIQPFIYFQF